MTRLDDKLKLKQLFCFCFFYTFSSALCLIKYANMHTCLELNPTRLRTNELFFFPHHYSLESGQSDYFIVPPACGMCGGRRVSGAAGDFSFFFFFYARSPRTTLSKHSAAISRPGSVFFFFLSSPPHPPPPVGRSVVRFLPFCGS